ncbi:hypothetical protein N219_00800 [Limosilactobacillus fermentum MTCC 8711]|nr:hypothetical protein N219_00800 [Limosilactobacillus fermentum MTCC 8711]
MLVVAGKAKVSLLTADGNENILYLLKGQKRPPPK